MLRALLAAIARLRSAVMTGIDWAWSFVTWPLRQIAPGPGCSALPPPPDVAGQIRDALAQADVATPSGLVRPVPSVRTAGHAKRVMEWAAATLADRYETAERISATLPAALRTWTQQLTNEHARLLLKAGIEGISAHVAGETLVGGVRPVRAIRPDGSALRSGPVGCESRTPAIQLCP